MAGKADYAWLLAQAQAWPLCSARAFAHGSIALARRHAGTLGGPEPVHAHTRELAEDLDAWLGERAGGWSLGVIRDLREAAWFRARDARVPLDAHVRRVADAYLARRGDQLALREDGDLAHADRVIHWRWLSLSMPADLLVAARAAGEGWEPATEHVVLDAGVLDRVLARPVAETHLHVGAAMPFPLLWTGLMADAAALDARARTLERGGAPPFGTGERLVAKLLGAAVARWILARYLHHRDRRDHHHRAHADMPLTAFLHAHGTDGVRGADGPGQPLVRMRRALAWLMSAGQPDARAVRQQVAEMQILYRSLVTALPGIEPVVPADVRDPVGFWFPPGRLLPETRLAMRALAHLGGAGARDEAFARLFWQYQRVRAQIFRHLTHRPGVEGLDWFGRHYQRIAGLRGPLEGRKYAIAIHTQGRGIRLAALEARTSPALDWRENLREVDALAAQVSEVQAGGHGALEAGLVLHWVKQREAEDGRLHEDPSHAVFRARHGLWFEDGRRRVAAVCRLLDEQPARLRWLRGVDVANLELSTSTWVTVPLIAALRDAARAAAARLAGQGMAVPPFRVTYHAGEEYRRRSEGLRRIHELIGFGVLENGDRIGHGLALGAGDDARVVPQPAHERLDDLLWEWERYDCGDVEQPGDRQDRVAREARVLSRAIYGEALPLPVLVAARRLRHNPEVLQRLGYPRCRPIARREGEALWLLWRYLTGTDAFERGQGSISVWLTDEESTAMAGLQAWLRGQVRVRGITVETNPSSNWLIAGLRDIHEHPSFRLQPLAGAADAVALSINTDNPLTFATCLADEYAYLFAGMMRAGVTPTQALAWLDRGREAGMCSRFTLRDPGAA